MTEYEAIWFAARLAELPAEAISPCCDIGSGAAARPSGIDLMLSPYGVRPITFDGRAGPGVDHAGDIFSPAICRELQRIRPRSIICNNMIEHLPAARIGEFANILDAALADGGYLLVSVPRSHPYHPDPIDNMFRPDPAQLAGLFPAMTVLAEAVVRGPTYWQELRKADRATYWRVVTRLLKPFRRFDRWKATAHRLLWLGRPYEQTCLVLQKPGATT
jgi:hypothetical protein